MTMNIRAVALIVLLAVLAIVLAAIVFSPAVGQGEADFLAYWSAAHLLATGANPYDAASLQALVLEMRPDRRPDQGHAFASWNPPWLLVVLLPLGLLPFDLAVRAWMLCGIGLIGGASMLVWRLLPEPLGKRGLLVAAAAGLLSGQGLLTVMAGQTSSLVLAGLVWSAWYLHCRRDLLAGAALLLVTIKPHITYLVLLLLLLWVARHRRWQVLWGMIASGLASMTLLTLIYPHWLSAYFTLIGQYRSWFFLYTTTTVGNWAHARWGTHVFRFAGILLLPCVLPLLQLADSRGWIRAMNAALLLSVPLAMYGFHFDQVVLLPTALEIIAWIWRRQLSAPWIWIAVGSLGILYFVSYGIMFNPAKFTDWFTWTPLALAALYALAWRERARWLGGRADSSVA